MYGLWSVTALKLSLDKKWISASGTCCFKQRIAAVVKTISPMDEKRMTKNFIEGIY
jgi:hypothetical protein